MEKSCVNKNILIALSLCPHQHPFIFCVRFVIHPQFLYVNIYKVQWLKTNKKKLCTEMLKKILKVLMTSVHINSGKWTLLMLCENFKPFSCTFFYSLPAIFTVILVYFYGIFIKMKDFFMDTFCTAAVAAVDEILKPAVKLWKMLIDMEWNEKSIFLACVLHI